MLLSGRGGLLLGETLLASVLGSAQSAHQLRVGLQLNDFELQHVLDGLLQAAFFAQPPVSVMLSVAPAFLAMTKQRLATAISMPAAISSVGLPSPTRVMTSDSAKTVHWP